MNITLLTLIVMYLGHLGSAGNVLMVVGGQSFNSSTRGHDHISQVEVIGPNSSCVLDETLPVAMYGLTAGKVGDTVIACGGYLDYYRSECYSYSRQTGSWSPAPNLNQSTAFLAGVALAGEFFIAGGRTWVVEGEREHSWNYYETVSVLRGSQWISLPSLSSPLADACMVITTEGRSRKRLWVIGGSDFPQRYKTNVISLDLEFPENGWTSMPPLLDARMWPGCAVTAINGIYGILVVGGYYNGASTMWLPLADSFGTSLERYGPQRNQPRWEYLSSLNKEKKWLPSIGFIGQDLTVAGGGDYGTDEVETLRGRDWVRSSVTMHFKREFAAGATVPSEWFPQCNF